MSRASRVPCRTECAKNKKIIKIQELFLTCLAEPNVPPDIGLGLVMLGLGLVLGLGFEFGFGLGLVMLSDEEDVPGPCLWRCVDMHLSLIHI